MNTKTPARTAIVFSGARGIGAALRLTIDGGMSL